MKVFLYNSCKYTINVFKLLNNCLTYYLHVMFFAISKSLLIMWKISQKHSSILIKNERSLSLCFCWYCELVYVWMIYFVNLDEYSILMISFLHLYFRVNPVKMYIFCDKSWLMFYFVMNPDDECSILLLILITVIFYFSMNLNECSILFQNKMSPALGLRSSKLRRAWVNCPRLITRLFASYLLISTGSYINHLSIIIVCIHNQKKLYIIGTINKWKFAKNKVSGHWWRKMLNKKKKSLIILCWL